jgi:hypothetical protein
LNQNPIGKQNAIGYRHGGNHVTVHSDLTAGIARVPHNKRGPGQPRAVKVIRHVQRLRNQGKRLSISWIKGHNGNTGNDCADALAGRAAENIPQSTSNSHQVSIAWMNQKVSQSYSEAATLELRDRGTQTIIPPPPKKSAMDKVRNRELGYPPSFGLIFGSLKYISSESATEPMQDAGSAKIDIIMCSHRK